MRIFSLCLLCTFFIHDLPTATASKAIRFTGRAQGTTYHITYYADDTLVRKQQIDSIFQKIDSSLSLYQSYSLVSQFNRSETGIEADEHLLHIVTKGKQVFRKTRGIFDITIFPLTDAWGFGPERHSGLPDSGRVKTILSCINTDLIVKNGNRLIKRKACVQLDPNGIAQGYTVDVIAEFFEKAGIGNFIIELGGEIRVKGRKPGGEKMSIGIETPGEDADFSVINKIIYPSSGAITTSGSYRRYYESDGKRVSHLLDPRTGYPVDNELISVTVYAKDAITADAYDNAIMAMGLKNGLAFVNRRRELAAHFIYRHSDGSIRDTMSRRFLKLLDSQPQPQP
ncbi:MAG TPA: FAD:protein FMN transferase [Chitinophagaceae bacterium]|nr:FAD:protein FMN transferase [Chitinophagaceae bacterium]